MNNVTLVGRLFNDPEIIENEDGTFRTTINVAVSRDYKNKEGIYETDFIRCVMWNGVATATKEYCRKGDVVGIKGKLQTRTYETDSKEKKSLLEVIADKVTFLSSVKTKEDDKEISKKNDKELA